MIRVRDDTSTAKKVKGDSELGEQLARLKAGEANSGQNQRRGANSKCSNISKSSDSAAATMRSRCARRGLSLQRLESRASRDVPHVQTCAILAHKRSTTIRCAHDTGRTEGNSGALQSLTRGEAHETAVSPCK